MGEEEGAGSSEYRQALKELRVIVKHLCVRNKYSPECFTMESIIDNVLQED